ncbi:unnamed protein product [Caenorhabditis nigoni]
MPAVEKRSMQVERKRWTSINERGGNYDNIDLVAPDTNGRYTNHWNAEYEETLPLHTSVVWKASRVSLNG